ncbi:MAG: hypothetical protein OXU27_16695 [Candidatus Poribacteria bacterium]|nr:hypothetical protein [Candidatus Poribacteria bacterium]MDD9975651.1 hypothetical protein [Candidatus Poribacteria bacterium]MDE0326923.1 hypothetical protein [Candidatus Poribacteria bacterium]
MIMAVSHQQSAVGFHQTEVSVAFTNTSHAESRWLLTHFLAV